MSGIQQMLTGGTYKAPAPTTIGQAYGGGYYAGKIAVGGGGVATHYLIVAPKATGENSGRAWGISGVTTSQTSVIDGPTNTTVEAALGASYEAATFCKGLSIGGYTDWYLPAKNELEVLYYFLKPDSIGNNTSSGSNANAVSPEPLSTNYTTGTPGQTTGAGFIFGQTNAFVLSVYWASTEINVTDAAWQNFNGGSQNTSDKSSSWYVRAVRRVPV